MNDIRCKMDWLVAGVALESQTLGGKIHEHFNKFAPYKAGLKIDRG